MSEGLPRVTEILKPFTGYDKVPKAILENAAERGTRVHAICAGVAKSEWIPESLVADDVKDYFESFMKWKLVYEPEFLIVEKRYEHDALKYTGQVDFVVKLEDGIFLVDLKTGSSKRTHDIQMAAYDALLKKNGIAVDGALLVYLDAHGAMADTIQVKDVTKKFCVFLSALECWNYFNRRGEYGKRNDG